MRRKRKLVVFTILAVLFSASLAFASLPLFQVSFQAPVLSEYGKQPALDKFRFESETPSRDQLVGDLNYRAWRRVQSSA